MVIDHGWDRDHKEQHKQRERHDFQPFRPAEEPHGADNREDDRGPGQKQLGPERGDTKLKTGIDDQGESPPVWLGGLS